MVSLQLQPPFEFATPYDSGWFSKREEPAESRPVPSSPPPSSSSSSSNRRALAVREEADLIGVETSKGRRYSYIAPRSGKRLGGK